MKAVVVYESLWGNTEAVARAIAEGLGPGAVALNTSEATGSAIADADLIVAGAPLHNMGLPTEQSRAVRRMDKAEEESPRDLSHPPLRSWLKALPQGAGLSAAFETRYRIALGGATDDITRGLEEAGYRNAAARERFIVKGLRGPLRDGELDRARAWGEKLARELRQVGSAR